jgi:hypothetical protein
MAKVPEEFEIKIRADVSEAMRQINHIWWKMFWYEWGPLILIGLALFIAIITMLIVT